MNGGVNAGCGGKGAEVMVVLFGEVDGGFDGVGGEVLVSGVMVDVLFEVGEIGFGICLGSDVAIGVDKDDVSNGVAVFLKFSGGFDSEVATCAVGDEGIRTLGLEGFDVVVVIGYRVGLGDEVKGIKGVGRECLA